MIQFPISNDQIRKFLPHRAPFLLVDRVLNIEISEQARGLGDLSEHILSSEDKVGTKVTAIKSVSYNEPFFQGHFPDMAIMPGVLIIESMAQTASFTLYPYMAKDLERIAGAFSCILVGVDAARFRRPVLPGDVMQIDTEVNKCRGKLYAFRCVVSVDGKPVAEAELLANLVSRSEKPVS